MSLLKDVTIRLRREGVQGKRDNVTLYDVFFEKALLTYQEPRSTKNPKTRNRKLTRKA